MLLINFSHPLTAVHLERVAALAGKAVARVIDVSTHFDHSGSFVDQVRQLVDRAGLNSTEWQTLPLLVCPPSLAVISCLLVAELHGRMGYFPTLLRLKPVLNAVPPSFEPAELLNLQSVRDLARTKR